MPELGVEPGKQRCKPSDPEGPAWRGNSIMGALHASTFANSPPASRRDEFPLKGGTQYIGLEADAGSMVFTAVSR